MESDAASVTTLSDGTQVFRDSAGEVVLTVTSAGVQVPGPGQQGSAIVQQFANLLDFWGRSSIEQRNRDAAINAQLRAAQAGLVVPGLNASMPGLLVLGALAVGAYLILRK